MCPRRRRKAAGTQFKAARPVARLHPFERIRDDKSVLIVPGDHFGLDNYIRISYGLPHDYLTAGPERIHAAIMELEA